MNDSSPKKGYVEAVREGPIGWIRLCNPARHNAMSMSMWSQLGACVDELSADPEVRVLVVAGEGNRAFCAGADISEFTSVREGAADGAAYESALRTSVDKLKNNPLPSIALIHGYCIGGGMGLALHCDLRIAADDARLGIPAAKRGLAYPLPDIQQLVACVGPTEAKRMLFTARQTGALEALQIGLVSEVHPAAELDAAVQALALLIAENAPLSVRAAKLSVDTVAKDPADRDLAACSAAEQQTLASEDYAEATRSFMEKRKPVFVGR